MNPTQKPICRTAQTNIFNGIIAFVFAIYATTSLAQSPAVIGESGNKKCQALLPFPAAEQSNCSPKFAAAYDFAFCFVNYSIAAHYASQSNSTQGSTAPQDALKKKAMVYAQVSVRLSDTDSFKKNIEYAKKHFEYLAKQTNEVRDTAIQFIARGCQNIEVQHSAVLEELVKDLQSKRAGSH
ncbi:MAG TPA: hypothetical protein VFQ99_02800 [Gallionella sp.]|nr:hypothetical protein [Gallionella sp.]